MSSNGLATEIQYLPGIGPKRAQLIKLELGLETVGDLLHFYPYRYADRGVIHKIADLEPTQAQVQILAKVTRVTLFGSGNRFIYQKELGGPPAEEFKRFNAAKRLSVMVSDGSGEIELVFFRGIKYTFQRLQLGAIFLFFGKPAAFNWRISITHPEIDNPPVMEGAAKTALSHTGTLTGIYTSTERLKSCGVTGKLMNKAIAAALNLALPEIEENLPEYILKDNNLVLKRYAVRNIHFPIDTAALEKASYRLKFEELFFLQLSLLKQKFIRRHNEKGILMPRVGEAFNQCYTSLPYELTNAQKRVIKEIRADMMSGSQMNRLLQGDVGSGKTMVAILTALIAVGNGYQACIMAPTEVLARQHFSNINKYLANTNVRCAALTGSSGRAERRRISEGLEDGSINIIIGTHALIEDNVQFKNLGLAIIDEQHRFGVGQRSKLWDKATGIAPHILVMTATPIPRTLAMTLYGDLDVSVIDELPPGRKPITTMQIGESKRRALYKFMKDEIKAGRQIFIVYPLIFENDKLDYQNIERGYEDIVKDFPIPDYKIAIMHGKQTNDEKVFNMKAFSAGRANILVSTTVIEVGVDVPNASVMVIMNAERFGLSQLHQLRGRVGRGSDKSYCILMRGNKISAESQQRLDLMCTTENGFELAEQDMKMRGPGDLEGTQQSGMPIDLKIASLSGDGSLLMRAKNYAEKILEEDSSLSLPKNALLAKELTKDRYKIQDYSKIS